MTFKYNNKLFNRLHKNFYVRFGYSVPENQLQNCVYIKDGKLIAIRINEKVEEPVANELLEESFFYDNGTYNAKVNIPILNSVADLRKDLYENGFLCDGIHYVRFKRSSGSSRVGKCLFIDERLYYKIHKWEDCDIKIEKIRKPDLAAYEAYIALTLSSIIDTVVIHPENILVIEDRKSIFRDDVIATRYKNGQLISEECNVEICNSIWDGQSLLDKSVFEKYENYGMLLLRNRFFKSCCFNTNIQKFFRDYGIRSISQLNGYTLAKDVSEVKLITTPSSIKYLKFGTLDQWLLSLEPAFGVVKHEKPTHFFDGRMVQTHYQLLNTLQLSYSEIESFMKPSLDYLTQLHTNPAVLRYHIQYPQQDFEFTSLSTKNDITFKLMGLNEAFSKTKLYYDFKMELLKSFKKNLRKGHILVNGNYSTLFGNPFEMLLSSIGKFDGDSILGVGNVHSKRFKYNQTLLSSRSPHTVIGNIYLPLNVENIILDRYFNLSKEIVCINSIGENTLQRLSGADFDSDTIMLTDNKILIDAAKRNYENFKVPTCLVESSRIVHAYSNMDKADLDIKTSVNKIGEIINFSQELNSCLWDNINNGQSINENLELYCDISTLSVMSGIEIDKAKKEYEVDNSCELRRLKKKYMLYTDEGQKIRPYFFSPLAKYKGFYVKGRISYQNHKTAMDYLQQCLNRFRLPYRNNGPFYKFSDIIDLHTYSTSRVKYDQVHKILAVVRDARKDILQIWNTENGLDGAVKFKKVSDIRQQCIDYVNAVKLSKDSMYWLLLSVERPENADISRHLMNILFSAPNHSFFSLLKRSEHYIHTLIPSASGHIKLYDFKYELL